MLAPAPRSPLLPGLAIVAAGSTSMSLSVALSLPMAEERHSDLAWHLVIGGPTVILSLAVVAAAIGLAGASSTVRHGAAPGVAMFLGVVGSVFAGVLNAGVCCALVTYVNGGGMARGAVEAFFLGSIFGSYLGGGFGLLFGLALAPMVGLIAYVRQHRALDAGDKLLLGGGPWLALLGCAGALVTEQPASRAPQVGLVAAGLAMVAIALIRDVRRFRLVRSIATGTTTAWTIAPFAPHVIAPLRAFLSLRERDLDGALCAASPVGAGAFRESQEHRPVAAMSGSASPALRLLRRRLCISAALLACLSALMVASLS